MDFKRVTIFIGPTGGGKSTLAKLAAVFRDVNLFFNQTIRKKNEVVDSNITDYGLQDFMDDYTMIEWSASWNSFLLTPAGLTSSSELRNSFEQKFGDELRDIIKKAGVNSLGEASVFDYDFISENINSFSQGELVEFWSIVGKYFSQSHYIPAERVLVASVISYAFGLQRQKVALPPLLVNFLSEFEEARMLLARHKNFMIPFLGISYTYQDNGNLVRFKGRNGMTELKLRESASGIQSVIPLLLVVEMNCHSESASFIIEEPELNLYPTAQQGLLNWLVEKCTKGENDLTITTHSPYLLAHLNTLLFAHQVAENHPERAEEVARIVPRESWIDPKEFAAYHVEGQQENGVRSIVNPETLLISYNGLDALATAEATQFEKLLDINAGLEVE